MLFVTKSLYFEHWNVFCHRKLAFCTPKLIFTHNSLLFLTLKHSLTRNRYLFQNQWESSPRYSTLYLFHLLYEIWFFFSFSFTEAFFFLYFWWENEKFSTESDIGNKLGAYWFLTLTLSEWSNDHQYLPSVG